MIEFIKNYPFCAVAIICAAVCFVLRCIANIEFLQLAVVLTTAIGGAVLWVFFVTWYSVDILGWVPANS